MSYYVKIGFIGVFLFVHLSTLLRLYKRGKGLGTAEVSELTMLVLLNTGMTMTYYRNISNSLTLYMNLPPLVGQRMGVFKVEFGG